MWIISQKRLKEFWRVEPRAQRPLREWYDVVSAAEWANFADVRSTYSSADLVGHCLVFNVSGNRYRLIARVFYRSHKVYVLKIMTHKDYDQTDWFHDCGCDRPPPKRKGGPK